MANEPVPASVTLRGLRFRSDAYGGADAGDRRAIVLLHGLASNRRWWLLVAPLLAARYRVIALDQRGHGESDKPDGGYDFESVVGDLAAFIDELSLERPVIAGHSWGGNVAIEYAATHPDAVAGVVLVDGGFMEIASRPGMTWEQAERDLAPPDLTSLTPDQLIAGAKRWELGAIWSDEVESALLGNFEVTEAGTVRPWLSRANHMQVVRALWEQRPSQLYERVRCPVLFVLAERAGGGRAHDWNEMKRQAIARAEGVLPDCRVLWLKDTIHDIPLHRPNELAAAIEQFAASIAEG
jgi:pimeloyl-ACP methyl ester carboxylesterase